MFYTYVLYSPNSNKIYIGQTENIEVRLSFHNHPKNRHWTRNFQSWEVVYFDEFGTRVEALNREKQLKSFQGREFIRKVIQELRVLP